MKQFCFLVSGSQPEPYEVIVKVVGKNLTATCTCAAGVNGQHCKHRLSLLTGDASALISDNEVEATELPHLLQGTDVEAAIAELTAAENDAIRAKKRVSDAKKVLGRALSN